ncbi:MAG: hypothetical protein DRJ40_10965 [Thermoprotei archaeon]|nr:MAG: hypothetical protein DRJ40_10965 [Thermoprotei archaeon]
MLSGYVVDYVADIFYDYLIERGFSRNSARFYRWVAKKVMRGETPNIDVSDSTIRNTKLAIILFKDFVTKHMDFFRQRGIDLDFVLDF